MTRLALALLLISAYPWTQADLFKCKQPNGSQVFQDTPCAAPETRSSRTPPAKSKATDEEQRRILEKAKEDLHKAQQAPPTYESTARKSQASSNAVSKEDAIDQITTEAVLIGRGIACGADTATRMSRVGKLIDSTFVPGTEEHSTHLSIFTAGVKYHADLQRNGKSPDSCASVLRALKSP
jgi:hypothetical protein